MPTGYAESGVSRMVEFPQKLGIIAGGGVLPHKLLTFCDSRNIQTFLIALEGQADVATIEGRKHIMTRVGAAGSIIEHLKENGCFDIVLIGAVTRPSFAEMLPDLRTTAFFAKIGWRVFGDDSLLKAISNELQAEGFRIHGIHEFMPELLMSKGAIGHAVPSGSQMNDIEVGLRAARKIGEEDIGQSVVVVNGIVVGTEDEKGTNSLIRRVAKRGAILVKSSKPQQERNLDMPTIGSQTIELCASLGYAGIAAEANSVLLADLDEMTRLANEAGIFVVGI